MKKIILFTILLVFLSCNIAEAEEIALTLDEAVSIALRDNRDILLKIEDIKKAKEEIAEAKAGLLPTLSFTTSFTNTLKYYPKDLSQTTTQTTLKQYLYKGGKTINTIKQNEYELDVSNALLDKEKLNVALNVKKAFYTLLLAKEFFEINKALIENIREHLNSIKERYKKGQASESEILNVKYSLDSAQKAYELSLTQVESSQTLLNNLLYLDDEIIITPLGEFNYKPIEVAYDEAFLKAMANRPEIKQYQAQMKADQRAIEVAKADNRPNIYASWDYYSRSRTSLTFTPGKGWQDYSIVGVTFSWPVFDGWLTKAKVEQAIIDLKESQLMKEKTTKDIALELKNAYLSLKDAISKIQSAESELKVYSDNLLSVNKKCNEGIVSYLELSDANLKYDISLFNKKQAIYDYIIAKISFDIATGGI